MPINGQHDGLFMKSANTGCFLILMGFGLCTALVIGFVLISFIG